MGNENFSEYGKKCGEAALLKWNACSILRKKCGGGGGVSVEGARHARVRTNRERKVTRAQDAEVRAEADAQVRGNARSDTPPPPPHF